jgi:hypothetical protein
MSEAPRVDLPDFTELDTSVTSNHMSSPSSTQPQVNGSTNGNLAQSAQKTGNSILESKVCGTKTPPHLAETQTNGIHHSLSAPCTPSLLPPNRFPSNTARDERRIKPPLGAEREGHSCEW